MSPKAAHYIKEILDRKVPVFVYLQQALFNLAADCAVLNNKIAPVNLLLPLLNTTWKSGAKKLLGERGLWVASQNAEWKDIITPKTPTFKKSQTETTAINALAQLPMKTVPNIYQKGFEILKKIGHNDDNSARVALFWTMLLEELEK